jgi:hypothetical protein
MRYIFVLFIIITVINYTQGYNAETKQHFRSDHFLDSMRSCISIVDSVELYECYFYLCATKVRRTNGQSMLCFFSKERIRQISVGNLENNSYQVIDIYGIHSHPKIFCNRMTIDTIDAIGYLTEEVLFKYRPKTIRTYLRDGVYIRVLKSKVNMKFYKVHCDPKELKKFYTRYGFYHEIKDSTHCYIPAEALYE